MQVSLIGLWPGSGFCIVARQRRASAPGLLRATAGACVQGMIWPGKTHISAAVMVT